MGAVEERIVKVTGMKDGRIYGFQLKNTIDEGPGRARTFNTNKIFRTIEFIGLRK